MALLSAEAVFLDYDLRVETLDELRSFSAGPASCHLYLSAPDQHSIHPLGHLLSSGLDIHDVPTQLYLPCHPSLVIKQISRETPKSLVFSRNSSSLYS